MTFSHYNNNQKTRYIMIEVVGVSKGLKFYLPSGRYRRMVKGIFRCLSSFIAI
ncbi:hypothetical protein Hanom_Chr07g00611051 [Helianthus anomalus]